MGLALSGLSRNDSLVTNKNVLRPRVIEHESVQSILSWYNPILRTHTAQLKYLVCAALGK